MYRMGRAAGRRFALGQSSKARGVATRPVGEGACRDRVAWSLVIVPHAEAKLLFMFVEELRLDGLAIEVLEARS